MIHVYSMLMCELRVVAWETMEILYHILHSTATFIRIAQLCTFETIVT